MFPQSLVYGRTFIASNFKAAYDLAAAPQSIHEIGDALGQLLRRYCTNRGIPWAGEGQTFFQALSQEAMAADAANARVSARTNTAEHAQRMWTSTRALQGQEFCSVLNDALRRDERDLADPVAVSLLLVAFMLSFLMQQFLTRSMRR